MYAWLWANPASRLNKLYILMVEGMFVIVNVMLSLMRVMIPPPALCNLSTHTVVKLCTFGVFDLGVSLVSWIVMIYVCVSWISGLTSSSLFLIPFMLTCSKMRLSHFYWWVCVFVWCLKAFGCIWSAWEVVLVPYVDAVVDVTWSLYCCMYVYWESARVTVMREYGMWVYGWHTWFRFCVYCWWRARDECGEWGDRWKCRWRVWNVYMFGTGRDKRYGGWVCERI